MSDIDSNSGTILSIPVDDEGINKLIDKLIETQKLKNDLNVKSIKIDFGDQIASQGNKSEKSINKTNKALKKTNKELQKINKKSKLFKLMNMGIKGIGAGIGAVAGLGGLSLGALLFGSLKNAGKNIQQQYSAQNLGMTVSESKALEVASEKITGSKSAFTQAVDSMVKALNDTSKSGLFPTLGLDQATLKTLNPEKAFELILESVRNMPQDITGQVYREPFEQITGGAVSYNVATQQGAGDLSKYFNQYLNKYSGVDFEALQKSSRALIDFQAQLDITSQKIGGKLAGPLADFAEKATPALELLTDSFTKFLDSISEEDITNFVNGLGKILKFVGKTAKGIFDVGTAVVSDEQPNLKKVEEKTVEQIESGDIGEAATTQLKSNVKQISNLFSEEGRKEQKEKGLETSVINQIRAGRTAKQIIEESQVTKETAENYGYINPKTQEFTQKAIEIQKSKSVGEVTSEALKKTVKGIGKSIVNFFTGNKEEEKTEPSQRAGRIFYTTTNENDIDNIDTKNNRELNTINNENNRSFINTENNTYSSNSEINNNRELNTINNRNSKSNNSNKTENNKTENSTYINNVNINVNNQKEAVSTFNDLSRSINTQANYGTTNMRSK